jgi:L-aminopeptidase/D-esterase-like protein
MWESAIPVRPGPANAITDVAGVLVGHHHQLEEGWATGATVVVTPDGAVGGVDVRGGGPGTRETDLLDPRNTVEKVHAVCLAGGSAYGLAVADGVMAWLAGQGIGLPVGTEPHEVVPIVPAAVLFDLKLNEWGHRPDASFGAAACAAATADPPAQGCVGAGTGATAGPLKGAIGGASAVLDDGTTVGVIVAVNARGHTVDPATGVPYAIGLGLGDEFDSWRPPADTDVEAAPERLAASAKMPRLNTTLAVVATDAALTKAECQKMAGMAHDGIARAIRPAHTPYDGDTVFALATSRRPVERASTDVYATGPTRAAFLGDIASAAADAVGRAVVHALFAASSVGTVPCYRDIFPTSFVNNRS